MGRAPKRKWATTVNWASQTIFRFHHAIFGIAEVVDHVANNGFPIPFPTTAGGFGKLWEAEMSKMMMRNQMRWLQHCSSFLQQFYVDSKYFESSCRSCRVIYCKSHVFKMSVWMLSCQEKGEEKKQLAIHHPSSFSQPGNASVFSPLPLELPGLRKWRCPQRSPTKTGQIKKTIQVNSPGIITLPVDHRQSALKKKNGKTCGNLLSDWQLLVIWENTTCSKKPQNVMRCLR